MRTWCDTHDSFVVDPQNHLAMEDVFSTEFGLKTQWWWFWRESKVACGIIMTGASRQNNFVWSAWPLDQNPRNWSIFSTMEWIGSMYIGVV
jgi:hypothetical protein